MRRGHVEGLDCSHTHSARVRRPFKPRVPARASCACTSTARAPSDLCFLVLPRTWNCRFCCILIPRSMGGPTPVLWHRDPVGGHDARALHHDLGTGSAPRGTGRARASQHPMNPNAPPHTQLSKAGKDQPHAHGSMRHLSRARTAAWHAIHTCRWESVEELPPFYSFKMRWFRVV